MKKRIIILIAISQLCRLILVGLALALASSFLSGQETLRVNKPVSTPVKIQWVDHLSGNFSFHLFHSIECEAWCYEYDGTNNIEVNRLSNNSFHCFTRESASTHCSLDLEILQDSCFATIVLNSISPGGSITFYCTKGTITIDRELLEKGKLKAVFSFDFGNKENPEQPIFWNGKIYARINLN